MLDRCGHDITYMRISVTEKCNLRCRYCMPGDAPCDKCSGDELTAQELLSAVRAAAQLGVKKLRITGGEPLIRSDIVQLCRDMAQVPGIEELCLTTNGILLPELALPLREAGVRRVNISLDTLDTEKYRSITRGGDLKRAAAGIRAALEAGFDRVKLNTVLIGGFNDTEVPELAALTLRYPLDVRFIELMPMTDGGFGREAYIPCSEVLRQLPQAESTGEDGVARTYMLPGAKGRIGLISPISDDFCGSCTRIRLTADGKLKPCLHSPEEFSIKGLDDDELLRCFETAIEAKPQRHGALGADSPSRAGRSMNRIGG